MGEKLPVQLSRPRPAWTFTTKAETIKFGLKAKAWPRAVRHCTALHKKTDIVSSCLFSYIRIRVSVGGRVRDSLSFSLN